jgi:hypothetical protein
MCLGDWARLGLVESRDISHVVAQEEEDDEDTDVLEPVPKINISILTDV